MNDPTQKPLIAAAAEHWKVSGAAAFAIPLPDTKPRVFIALGTPEQIVEIMKLAGDVPSAPAR